MTILVTGGTGKTGAKLAQLLHSSNQSVLVASRTGIAPSPLKAVKFDWSDPQTFENPFIFDQAIDKIYLIAPPIRDSLPVVKPFIDYAISKGVKRFVHGSSSAMGKGDTTDGKIHEYLSNIGVDYVIIRPTWFIENLSTFYLPGIRDKDEITSVTEDGRVGFVGVDDIAQAAYNALITDKCPNSDFFVVGPELYSYDEMAALLSDQLGRRIRHRKLSHEESRKFWESFDLNEDYAAILTEMEAKIAEGYEESISKTRNTIVGNVRLREYVSSNASLWAKSR